MAAAGVDEMQAAAEPVVVGPDTSNLERAGRATNDKVGKQTQPLEINETFEDR